VTDAPPEQTAKGDPHADLAALEERKVLDDILSELDEDKRAVFVLYEIESLPMNDVAEAVGCPVQTAYSRLHAARALVTAAARRRQEGRGT
jgi:RNA polymerase sigma-70 factor (ECF subfamily)